MTTNFYDKVAKKFGGYGYGNGRKPIYTKEFLTEDPEAVFKAKILDLADKNKTALDVGCADGKFTVSIMPHFKKIYGIDNSKVNLAIALERKIKDGNTIEYSQQDASKTSFPDALFDVVYSRRGPSFYKEYYRILKSGGYYLEIDIGEKDTMELKKIFGRGQNYGQWDHSLLAKNTKAFQRLGYKVVFAHEYFANEYYPSYREFDIFLQQVPIFKDYDPEKDKPLVQKYVKKFTTKKGIQLSRHRVVFVAQK